MIICINSTGTTNMSRFFIAAIMAVAISTVQAYGDEPYKICFKPSKGAFTIADSNSSAPLLIDQDDALVVKKAGAMFADDVWQVTGKRPVCITTGIDHKLPKVCIIAGTIGKSRFIDQMIKNRKLDVTPLNDGWEQYIITQVRRPMKGISHALVIAGSDRRGTAYGLLSISRQMGVSPWNWWADIPDSRHQAVYVSGTTVSERPSVKYRGIFINDEDWGMKPWAAKNYESKLGDIGPKTYSRVCELLLRLRGNMLAPAMHECTGAFYSHKESKAVADTFGIVITTSHCEPLLINTAAKSEWDVKRDGDWNYKTNREAIIAKWDSRLKEAAQLENIYTLAMRGLHDAGLRGNLPVNERIPLIEQVIRDQRQLLSDNIPGQVVGQIPQIFVPYKETMDIYENGLRVPDDVTLVWVDDNYGYMKRVSSPEEQQRKGGSGIYYHLSYLGAPHDYLWLNTTAPVLMYEELKKGYDTGADRYWLLNVGDIKPMEMGIQTFFDMACEFKDFSFEKARTHQAQFLASIFGEDITKAKKISQTAVEAEFQKMLDDWYRLAWLRKPEFMGFECEWDDKAHTGLRDTPFSFSNYNDAQQRLADYKKLALWATDTQKLLADERQDAFLQIVGYPFRAAYEMNRKFLLAQLNHEMAEAGKKAEANWAAGQSKDAYLQIESLTNAYNGQKNGKWNGMMAVPGGYCALYQNMPEVKEFPDVGTQPIDLSPKTERNVLTNCAVINLEKFSSATDDISVVYGIGYDNRVIQMGKPTNIGIQQPHLTYQLPQVNNSDSIDVTVHIVPFWPLYKGKDQSIYLSVDNCDSKTFNNEFREYSRNWKDQVLRNGASCTFRFPINKSLHKHTLTISSANPGQMIQRIIIDWGGLKDTYVGPSIIDTI